MNILKYADQKVLRKTDNDEVIEYERYALRLHQGLARTRRSFEGKRGGLIKTEHALKEYERLVTNVPDEIVKIAFGDRVKANEVMTFEQAYKLFMSSDFPWKNNREKIIQGLLKEIKGVAPVPSEVADDWSELIEN